MKTSRDICIQSYIGYYYAYAVYIYACISHTHTHIHIYTYVLTTYEIESCI